MWYKSSEKEAGQNDFTCARNEENVLLKEEPGVFVTTNDASSLFNTDKPSFNRISPIKTGDPESIFSGNTSTGLTTPFEGFLFGSTVNASIHNNVDSSKIFDFSDLKAKIEELELANFAANKNNMTSIKSIEKPEPFNFIGLTHQHEFSSFLKSSEIPKNVDDDVDENIDSGKAGNNENYEPQYDSIIQLPKEIVVSSGGEHETELFCERAMLFRFDNETKQWKERGDGEIKLLVHSKNCRFRLILRRDHVHKLVLNFPITVDFRFSSMKNNEKSFIFVGMNYAESSEGDYEKLAVRFEKPEIAVAFSNQMNLCIEELQRMAKA